MFRFVTTSAVLFIIYYLHYEGSYFILDRTNSIRIGAEPVHDFNVIMTSWVSFYRTKNCGYIEQDGYIDEAG